jgi:Cdc6-like AAA superfamily ATPase
MEKSELLLNVANSQHYKGFAIEPIQYIEANNLGFHEGNIIKYVSRWRQKDGLADLRKAKFYIERLIELAESEQAAREGKQAQ